MASLHEPLEAPAVQETVAELYARISARFPDRGLRGVCADLITLVGEVESAADTGFRQIRTARAVSRVLMVLVIAVTVGALGLAIRDAVTDVHSSLDFLSLAETTISDVVYAAVAIAFLWAVPERMQRSRLLRLLHSLRSTAHVIDMHQLTKDPEQLRPSFVPTAVSKPLGMSRNQVERYLDYCSEMLSLVAKTAALCAEASQDAVILDTVNSIEQLTVGLSRKIWQKIANLPPATEADLAEAVGARQAHHGHEAPQPRRSSTSS